MIKRFQEFTLNESNGLDFWYPQFKGRFYRTEEQARNDIFNAVEHRNKQIGAMFKKYDAEEVTKLFTVVQNQKLKRDSWYIKPVQGLKLSAKPKKDIIYETSPELRRKQIHVWEEVHGTEFGRSFSALHWLPTKDKRIYGTERTDNANLENIKRAMKDSVEFQPILLDYDYGILDGHHRYEAALALKIKEIPVIIYMRNEEDDE